MPQTVSAAARTSTMNRLRIEYSMIFSITITFSGKTDRHRVGRVAPTRFSYSLHLFFMQLRNRLLAARLDSEPAADLVSRLNALENLCICDGKLHFHGHHQAGDLLVVDRDC